MTLTAAEVFRDFQIDGDPSSAPHQPIKAEIRELLALLEAGGLPVVQVETGASAVVEEDTTYLVVNRSAPSATGITLPDAAARGGRRLSVVDYSQSIVEHITTLTPFDPDQTIMRQATWSLLSNEANLASVTLVPIVDPDDATNHVWVIAP